MRRREFIAVLGGTAAWPLVARAQTKMPRLGVLRGLSKWRRRELGGFGAVGEPNFSSGMRAANYTLVWCFVELAVCCLQDTVLAV
jgi:hypothetical protein